MDVLALQHLAIDENEVNIEELKKAHELQQKIETNVSLLEKYREADTVIVRSGAESIANTILLTTVSYQRRDWRYDRLYPRAPYQEDAGGTTSARHR
jgi:hypothetical protein